MFDVYFEDNYFNRQLLATVETEEKGYSFMYHYLREHGYAIPYCRTWRERDEIWVDFGSHYEFFIMKEAADDEV